MPDKHRRAWKHLRRLRLGALAALLILPPAGIAWAILVEPHVADGSSRVSMLITVVPLAILIKLITGFECPGCRKPFSSGGRTGIHLTNQRCVNCGLAIGGSQ